ncbi:MAG: SRPBCC family protein [Cyclobacteriaceae bacterium]
MKAIVSIFTVVLCLGIIAPKSSYAQNADAKKTYTQVAEASADDVWTVIRKMDEVDKYSSGIARLEWKGDMGVGGSRVCYAPDGKGYFKENIVEYDDNARSFSYAVVEGVPFKGMVNSWKVVDLGYNKSMIVWTSNYEEFVENPQMTKEQFMGFIDMSLKEFVGNVLAEATM